MNLRERLLFEESDKMEDSIKRLNRELIHKGSIIDYYQDTMLFPNGNREKWDFIDHHGAAAVLPITEDGKVLLVRQYRNALERYTLEIPAGGVNRGESMKAAAARELEEETGYSSDDLEFLLSLRTTVAFCNERIDVYLAKSLKKTHQHLDENEYVDVEIHSFDKLRQLIFDGMIQDSKTVSSIMTYLVKYGDPASE